METKTPVQKPLDKKNIRLSRIKRKILKHVWVVRAAIAVLIFLVVYSMFLASSALWRKHNMELYWSLAKDFVFTPTEKIKSDEGRTNILILGKGGESHESPDLTDTIMLASIYHPKTSGFAGLRDSGESAQITLISLPRDIWLDELRDKLNSAYYWGNKKESNGGINLSKSNVESILGKPISYVVVIDFNGFKAVIDELGGVPVEVVNAFEDRRYPLPGKENDLCDGDIKYSCRYETISFEKGVMNMDGETALKFVRSRHAEGDEGTDFARAARQQQVIAGIKKKILSQEIITSPKKMLAVWEVVKSYTQSDLDPPALAILTRRGLQAKENINSYVLPQDMLINPPYIPKYDNLYVFIPKNGSWENVHSWVDCVLKNGECG
jgi:polyisoprenyl-teichoic acid--peptidoglycan teichoic acid transferase